MRAFVLVLVLAAVACEHVDAMESNRCPPGTQTIEWPSSQSLRTWRHCELPGHRVHGPSVEIDKQGVELRLGTFVQGKKEGLFLDYDKDGRLRMTINYRNGLPHGAATITYPGMMFRSYFRDGLRDGPNELWKDDYRDAFEYYAAGKRIGLAFDAAAKSGRHRLYSDGVLILYDGRLVPPLDRVTLANGRVVERSTCLPIAAPPLPDDGCANMFEKVQICALDPATRETCAAKAMKGYGTVPKPPDID